VGRYGPVLAVEHLPLVPPLREQLVVASSAVGRAARVIEGDEIRLVAIGLVRAKMAQDDEALRVLLTDVDWLELVSCLVGICEALLVTTLGDGWAEQLDAWTRAALAEDTS
jgi:hypothetical protein